MTNQTIKAKDVQHNGFSENLDKDFIAVDSNGRPVSRASTRESVERAAPNHSGIFTGKDFSKADTEPKEVPDVAMSNGVKADPTAVATARPAEDDKFAEAIKGAHQASDEGQKQSEQETADKAEASRGKKADDSDKTDDKSDDKADTKTDRQRKPAGK